MFFDHVNNSPVWFGRHSEIEEGIKNQMKNVLQRTEKNKYGGSLETTAGRVATLRLVEVGDAMAICHSKDTDWRELVAWY